MDAVLIAVLIVAILAIVTLLRSVRIVPQARAAVVERLGRYTRTQGPGVAILLPFVDRMRPLIDMREQVVSFPPQPVITSDNLTVGIDSVIYFQVTDPRAATYEIQNYIQAVEQLTITTLRNVVGSLNLEQTLTSRDGINTQLRGVLDEATGPWGIRVARVEIKAIEPPASIRDAMEKQMRADRDKRAIILSAEGQRESAIKTAEGQKAAQILAAEGAKTAAILSAEAERQSQILRAEGERAARYLSAQGEAKAIETTFGAIHAARPDPALLAYQYLQTLPRIAQGDANKMWIVPSEFSKALEGLAGLAGAAGGGWSGGPVTGAVLAGGQLHRRRRGGGRRGRQRRRRCRGDPHRRLVRLQPAAGRRRSPRPATCAPPTTTRTAGPRTRASPTMLDDPSRPPSRPDQALSLQPGPAAGPAR